MPRKNKPVGFLRSLPIPGRLQMEPAVPVRMKISECVSIFRPLVYCLFMCMYDEKSFKPTIVSMALDALVLLLRMNYKRRNIPEIEELRSRNRELWYVYLFRKPIYSQFFKPKLMEPLIRRVIKWESLANLVIQSIDFRTSYSLTM